jgi:repressor LexA
MMRLTPRQTEALTLIRNFIFEEGVPPSLTELARLLKLESKFSALELVRGLARKGYISRVPRRARGIRVLRDEHGNALTAPEGIDGAG